MLIKKNLQKKEKKNIRKLSQLLFTLKKKANKLQDFAVSSVRSYLLVWVFLLSKPIKSLFSKPCGLVLSCCAQLSFKTTRDTIQKSFQRCFK